MKTLRIALASFALLVSAGTTLNAQDAPPPTPKPAFEGAGQYELSITFGGQAMPIFLELIKEKDAWRGTAGNPNLGTANVTGVKQEGRTLSINLATTDGPTFLMTLTVKDDNTVTGRWEGNGDGSVVTGKKTK